MTNKNILVIDDEINICKLVKMNLELSSFKVDFALNGEEGLNNINNKIPDLVIIDLMLPDMDGFEICRRIRTSNTTKDLPIIMLTAKSEETDKVIGLEIGADDYITKPFGLRELVARVKAVLRRTSNSFNNGNNDKVLKYYDIEIDTEKHILRKKGKEIELTYMEFNLVKILAENKGEVLSRTLLLEETIRDKENNYARTIDVHITNLRKKLKKIDDEYNYIETVRGIGYMFK